jgi:hypothetical protein
MKTKVYTHQVFKILCYLQKNHFQDPCLDPALIGCSLAYASLSNKGIHNPFFVCKGVHYQILIITTFANAQTLHIDSDVILFVAELHVLNFSRYLSRA